MIKVSVIVPVYNGESYLEECLESLRAQTLEEIEFICINDGSKDTSLKILYEYAERDSRFVVVDKLNTGYGDTMNKGIEIARGVFIGSVESDDYVVSDAYEKMLALAEEKNLDFVKAGRLKFYGSEDCRDYGPSPMIRNSGQSEDVFSPSENPWRNSMGVGQPGLFRKSFLLEHDIRYNTTAGASFQDTGFWAQTLFHATRVQIIDEPLYMIRRDNPNSSEMDSSKVFCICEEYDFVRKKAMLLKGDARRICLWSTASFMLDSYRWNRDRLQDEDQERFVERARRDFLKLRDAGELNKEFFSEKRWTELLLLLDRPMEYFATYCSSGKHAAKLNEGEAEKLRCQIVALKSSNSYRIGRCITWLPRKLKQVIGAAKRLARKALA